MFLHWWEQFCFFRQIDLMMIGIADFRELLAIVLQYTIKCIAGYYRLLVCEQLLLFRLHYKPNVALFTQMFDIGEPLVRRQFSSVENQR